MAGRCHAHAALGQGLVVDGGAHAELGLPVEPVGERAAQHLADMQDEHDGHREVGRQRAQDLRQRRRSARRGAERDEAHRLETRRRRQRARQRRRARPAPVGVDGGAGRAIAARGDVHARMGAHLDPRRDAHREQEALLPGAAVVLAGARLFDHVDGAGDERLVAPEQLAAIGGAGDDHDRRRAIGHDVLGRGQPAQDRQDQLERDHVGAQLLAQLDAALAVLGLAHDLEVGRLRQRLDDALAHGQRILDHQDANL
jgi:hypothetical protein